MEKTHQLTPDQQKVVDQSRKEIEDSFRENERKDLKGKEHEHHYPTDKNGWVVSTNKSIKKVKLRAFIAKRAQELRFLDQYTTLSKTREVLIEKYNEGGVNLVEKFVNSEFLKEVQCSYDEVKVQEDGK